MDASAFIQERFRIRLADTVGLNADSGWAAAENVNANIGTGQEFRIRFKIRETAGGTDSTGFKLQVNREGAGWNDVTVLSDVGSEAVQAVLSSQFNDGDATSTELLTNQGATYVNGEGLEDNTSASHSLTSEETELEWCLWIQSFHDNHLQNIAGDELEFRVVESDGTVFGGTYTNPTITVSETAGYVGGVFIESPHRLGPYKDTNGNLYFFIESSGTIEDSAPVIIKSANGGDTWREMDGANRPTKKDLEAADIVLVDDTLHILVQRGAAADDVHYHTFRMSDHASPDTWDIVDDEVVALGGAATDQEANLEVYADGRVIALYRRTDGNEGVYYKIRSTGGTWGSEVEVDTTGSVDFLGGMMIKGESDKMHIFYKDDTNGDLYHKSLPDGGSLGSREIISTDSASGVSDDEKPIIPPVYWDDGGDEKIMVLYKESTDDKLYSRIITNDGSPATATSASDNATASHQAGSNQPVADLVMDGKNALLFYSDRTDLDIYKDENSNGGGWGTDIEHRDAITAEFIRGRVFTHSSGNGGDKVFGYVWDYGDGGSGRLFYDEFVIATGGSSQTITTVEIPSGQVVSTLSLTNLNTLLPVDIASGQAVSAPTLTPGVVTTLPVEIVSGQVVSMPVLTNLNTLSLTEIASGQAVSTPTVSSLATLLSIEIASGQVVSIPTLLPGAVSALPVEIASGQVVSIPVLTFVSTLSPTEIASSQAVSIPTLISLATITALEIASGQIISAPNLLNVNTLLPLAISSGSTVPVPVLLNVNILTMIEIASGQAIPVLTLLAGGVNVSPVEIATGQAVNIPTLLNVSTLSPSEIASGQAFGTPTLSSLTTIVMIDIASGQVVSIPVLLPELFLSPVSIGSDQVVSIPSLLNVNTITVVEVSDGSLVSVPSLSSLATIVMIDIASGQAIPVLVVQSGLILSPLELGDLSVVSTPTLLPGAVSTSPVDIASGQAVPIPSLSSLSTLVVVEIATGSVVSIPVLLSSITVSPLEIPSGSALGVPVLDATATILPIHILSGLSVPGPALSVLSTLTVTEIGSGQAIPTPTVSPGVVIAVPVSIASGSSVGVLTLVLGGDFVQPVEVVSGSVVSTPSLIPGVALISPVEIGSGSLVSVPVIFSTLILSPVAIASGQVVSIPVLFGGGGVVILFRDQIVLVTFDVQSGIIQFRDQPILILYEVD